MKTLKNACKRLTACIVALSVVFGLGGCYDRRELNTLSIVFGTAIDKADKKGETTITFQIADVGGEGKSEKGSPKGSGQMSTQYLNISNTGKNANNIIRDMDHILSREVYIAHNQVIVIGEDLAREGVRDSLDFFARSPEGRLNVYIFVARGKGSDILETEPKLEKMPSDDLVRTLMVQKRTSEAPIITEFDLIKGLISKTTCSIVPIVYIKEIEDKENVCVEGCAVFKDGKMIAELDKKETRGVLWIRNEVKNGAFLVDVEGTKATVEIREARSKVKPEIRDDGKIVLKIQVNAMVGLGDQYGKFNLSDPTNIPEGLKMTERAIRKEIRNAFNKVKAINADVIGFGDCLRQRYPKKWEQVKDHWDETFKDIEAEITVKIKADGNGRIDTPLHPSQG
ncbi:MAG: Ger(x)C family spore germination protein [Clostridiales bacterium]|nr:Ger(x)C family spore germination protein [Clostridiales bacterium]